MTKAAAMLYTKSKEKKRRLRPMEEIGKKIAALRQKTNTTRKELAEFFGVSVQCLSLWETGKRSINLENLQKFADFFNVSLTDLLTSDAEELKDACTTAEERELIKMIDQMEQKELEKLGTFIDLIISKRK